MNYTNYSISLNEKIILKMLTYFFHKLEVMIKWSLFGLLSRIDRFYLVSMSTVRAVRR